MKRRILLLVLALICVSSSFAYEAYTYTFIIDASASVSDSDFEVSNANIASALDYLYELEMRNTGYYANMVSIAWFGGTDDYIYLDFVNASDYESMAYAWEETYYKTHPDYGATAIYSALAYSTVVTDNFENYYNTDYLNIYFIITDGEDGDSPADHQAYIESMFPNDGAFVCVIGVGSNANVSEFYSIADEVVSLNDFSEIFVAITSIQELFN